MLFFLGAFDATKEFSGLWKPAPYGKVLTNFYQRSHYKREIPVKEMNQLIKALPPKVSVSATFYMVPHIANRKQIYQFPEIKEAEYILTVNDGSVYYPLDSASYQPVFDSIINSGSWNIELKTDHGYLLKRK